MAGPLVLLTTLSADECWTRLTAHRPALGRVAFADAGRMVIYPMNYAVHGRSVYLRTDPASRLTTVGETEPVAFEVDDVDSAWEQGWSVLVQGTLHPVIDAAELDRNRDLRLHTWAPGDRLHLLRLDVEEISGRRIS
jgi:nitroimidazol reductase NimA-like FMN-containing flavoprotein (pyridoxamine 5'-phosphate oxidase superfamily)